MKEYEILAHTLKYLKKKKGKAIEIVSLSTNSKKIQKSLREIGMNLPKNLVFKRSGPDIICKIYSQNNHKQQSLLKIEAKAGDKNYSTNKIYTALGQLINFIEKGNRYYKYALVFPSSWKDKIKEILTYQEQEKPVIKFIGDEYQITFYFVDENTEKVTEKKTWKQFIKFDSLKG